ncbi:DUF4440 domain-containing protein [Vannielia litorea]|uniref:DUF4440 domain-containing protein n=1 Tax=Vannielia litorea TaxID=1217970 RepID=UPI001C971752|nr:DUF4440 domain-containing protein [Vannielia litorea]MBY6047435.1 nuclear transport factor 2 family protein [Vannielia litorea]MBY6074849.1 nuclear transport factor 2 family protein [Vannielia litorea]
MTEADFWKMEEKYWTGGADYARSVTRDDAVFVFPYPAGILGAEASMKGLEGAAPWRSVTFHDHSFTRQGPVAVLAYKAQAERDGEDYTALCASTYVDDGDGWRMMSHQQTPAAVADAGA